MRVKARPKECVRTENCKFSPEGTAENCQDLVLGALDFGGSDWRPEQFSAVPSGLVFSPVPTQDCVLGYFQPSLRD